MDFIKPGYDKQMYSIMQTYFSVTNFGGRIDWWACRKVKTMILHQTTIPYTTYNLKKLASEMIQKLLTCMNKEVLAQNALEG